MQPAKGVAMAHVLGVPTPVRATAVTPAPAAALAAAIKAVLICVRILAKAGARLLAITHALVVVPG